MSRRIVTKPVIKPVTVLLRQIQAAMRRAVEEALQPSGLTAAQANVLMELAYGPARSNAQLARAHCVTPQTMVEILASLERRGLISRSAKPEGGRAMPAELTKQGRAQVLSTHMAMRQVEDRLLRALPRDDVSRLRKFLQACLMALEKAQPGGGE